MTIPRGFLDNYKAIDSTTFWVSYTWILDAEIKSLKKIHEHLFICFSLLHR
jgi:hypothetical protein